MAKKRLYLDLETDVDKKVAMAAVKTKRSKKAMMEVLIEEAVDKYLTKES